MATASRAVYGDGYREVKGCYRHDGALYRRGRLTQLWLLHRRACSTTVKKNTHTCPSASRQNCQVATQLHQEVREAIQEIADPEKREPGFLHILVLNTEAFSTAKGATAAERFVKLNPNCITILDKAPRSRTRVPSTKTDQDRSASSTTYPDGLAYHKSPMDLFSQCAFLEQEALGFNSFYGFQGRYAVVQRRTWDRIVSMRLSDIVA